MNNKILKELYSYSQITEEEFSLLCQEFMIPEVETKRRLAELEVIKRHSRKHFFPATVHKLPLSKRWTMFIRSLRARYEAQELKKTVFAGSSLKTFDEWKNFNRQVMYKQKAHSFDVYGIALFEFTQTKPTVKWVSNKRLVWMYLIGKIR